MMKVSRRGVKHPFTTDGTEAHEASRSEVSSLSSAPSVVVTLNLMRIAYLECFSGISGDMFLGALVDAGVPPRLLQETVAALGVGAHLEISRVVRSGISATKVDVWVDGEKDLPREQYWARQDVARALSPAKPKHENGHLHDHDHLHEHEHEHSRAGAPAPHTHT